MWCMSAMARHLESRIYLAERGTPSMEISNRAAGAFPIGVIDHPFLLKRSLALGGALGPYYGVAFRIEGLL